MTPPLGWLGIVRLGLVQASLGAVVVLMVSVLNRVMVVELGFAALVGGLLVAVYHAVQILRPRFGHGSDVGGRRTPWIVGGMALLSASGVLAATATALMATSAGSGIALAAVAYFLIGCGGGAAGTSLLALTAARVAPERRPAAAAILWLMMIVGFIITGITAGSLLDPYSHSRLVAVVAVVTAAAFVIACLAIRGLEGPTRSVAANVAGGDQPSFGEVLKGIWAEREARRFTVFVFVSMLAYSAQDLILEPFAGLVFAMTPGETTRLSSVQYTGVLLGMITVAVLGGRGLTPMGWMRRWTAAGCVASALALLGLVVGASWGEGWPLRLNVFALGYANGVFAVAAIGSMMTLASTGAAGREGVRLGLWGASQAIASAVGGSLGTVVVDLARVLTGAPAQAYATVFALEAVLFIAAAVLALNITSPFKRDLAPPLRTPGTMHAPHAGG